MNQPTFMDKVAGMGECFDDIVANWLGVRTPCCRRVSTLTAECQRLVGD